MRTVHLLPHADPAWPDQAGSGPGLRPNPPARPWLGCPGGGPARMHHGPWPGRVTVCEFDWLGAGIDLACWTVADHDGTGWIAIIDRAQYRSIGRALDATAIHRRLRAAYLWQIACQHTGSPPMLRPDR